MLLDMIMIVLRKEYLVPKSPDVVANTIDVKGKLRETLKKYRERSRENKNSN